MSNVLLRGDEKLAQYPNFKLKGRSNELSRLFAILLRSRANSILLVGPGGVGCTALCLALHASKKEPNTPFDIVVKRFFWLDTNRLFSSGDTNTINTTFKQVLDVLYRTPDSVLIIEDTKDFIEAAKNNNSLYFINALTLAVKNSQTQIILEARDEDLGSIMKCHSDIRECYTVFDLEEPTGSDLKEIVSHIGESLAKFHGISIAPDAIETAIATTNKYRTRDIGLSRAQPERSITLLDRAISAYRLAEHIKPVRLSQLESQFEKTADPALLTKIEIIKKEWHSTQSRLKHLYKDQREAEVELIALEMKLAQQQEQESKKQTIKGAISEFSAATLRGGFDSEEVKEIKIQIIKYQQVVSENKQQFDALTNEINKSLVLTRDLVLAEFSRISGIPVDKLTENAKVKLINLNIALKKRIFGQDHIIDQVSDGIKVARIGKRTKGEPVAYLFMGPSGVGKTELAKALAAELFDDENALFRFDMSEYMEKHAVAKMIGAPPGYEGFNEEGGVLTQGMRRNPNRVLLFDEIEKAHPDVFNIFLQILSDGRLSDSIGRTVQFSQSILIMTTNIGQQIFLDNHNFDEARILAIQELTKTYRSEFLNRFNGRQNLLCFHPLDIGSIQKIVMREIASIDQTYRGDGITINISQDNLEKFCLDQYNPLLGARGLPGYIKTNVESVIVNHLLNEEHGGKINLIYDVAEKKFVINIE